MDIFCTGESGVICNAMCHAIFDSKKYSNMNVLNTNYFNTMDFFRDEKEFETAKSIFKLKKHQSFKVRKPEIDITDTDLLQSNLMKKVWEQTDVIIHSAAAVGTDFVANDPEQSIKTNVNGTFNIVEICNKYNIKLVYFSTTAIFDPKDYSKDKLMTEDTKIDPQTLYGITKNTGESIVKQLCKTDKIIVRPVFGFSGYPDDLHSALTKLIYRILLPEDMSVKYNKLNILLDPIIKKSYTRVENIAEVVLQIVNSTNCWNQVFNIGTSARYDWNEMINMITNVLSSRNFSGIFDTDNVYDLVDKRVEERITFEPKKDYLHYHTIDNSKLNKFGIHTFDNDNNKNFLENGIEQTIYSVIKNINTVPYWL